MRDVESLLHEVNELARRVDAEASAIVSRWDLDGPRADARIGARNLAAYLAFRHHDLRTLQRELMVNGLSSLGRLESRVRPTLDAVRSVLGALAGQPSGGLPAPQAFFEGERLLKAHTDEVFGPPGGGPIRLMVTVPSEAAFEPAFFRRLIDRDVRVFRINCAHDDQARWLQMIEHARAAEAAAGKPIRIMMDLAGPKLRTALSGADVGEGSARVHAGDEFGLTAPGAVLPSALEEGLRPGIAGVVECTLEAPLRAAKPGQRVFYDDGKLSAEVVAVEPWGLRLRVIACPERGVRLRPEKGLNFPQTAFEVEALTAKDNEDLPFVARHADGIGFSFVQSRDDVASLHRALRQMAPAWRELALILKIETPTAVRNLPDLMVASATHQPTAVMIARGDLAVELGFARTAEMQEEILWLAEAAHVPVIWATQVMENFLKKGKHSRGEMTDAAMGARAECVMLNKGPFLIEGIDILRGLFDRMVEHIDKKTPRLRALRSWDAY